MTNIYGIEELKQGYVSLEGRILEKDEMYYLGFTNSSMTFTVRGTVTEEMTVAGDSAGGMKVKTEIHTQEGAEVNEAGLRIYVDGVKTKEIVVKHETTDYEIAELSDGDLHTIRVVKITEAAMSYAAVKKIEIENGELVKQPDQEDTRTKVEFIGDSITCGYGVLGEPESEYTIREEDGELCYAAFMSKEMNWNASWISASGYGMYQDYEEQPENNVPKLYPYVNWFVDSTIRMNYADFEPEFIFINLGTNDCNYFHKESGLQGYIKAYQDFLWVLRKAHPQAKIICTIGTECETAYPHILTAVEAVRAEGFDGVYTYELPYHNVELDGIASGHPTEATHRKDARRLLDYMKQEGLL